MDDTTNTLAEATNLLKANIHCKHEGYKQVIFQMNLLLVNRVIIGEWECPWSIADITTEFKENIEGKEAIMQYIYRKENQLADYLPNHITNRENCNDDNVMLQIFGSWNFLSSEISVLTTTHPTSRIVSWWVRWL